MSLSEVEISIKDPSLGIVPQATDDLCAAIGICSKGTENVVHVFADKQSLRDALGVGPLVEFVAHLLDIAGGPVYAVRATQAVAGAAGAVTKSGTGPDVTVSGAAADSFNVIVEIVKGGAVGTATFKVSLDGGDNYSPEIATAATYAIPDTGLTLAFAAGTYVAADTYSFACTAPLYDSTALGTALDALLADPREWRFISVVGEAANAAASATLAAVLKVKLEAARVAYRYVRGLMQAADDTDANLLAGFASFEDGRVAVCAGKAEVVSSVTSRPEKRAALFPVAARAAKASISEDLGRVASGSVPGVTKLYRDERTAQGLDAGRFTTLRSFVGAAGYYITAGRTMAAKTSDYQLLQHGFVVDKGCKVLRNALLRYLNDSVRVDKATGFILEIDAKAIESEVQAQLQAALVAPGDASSVAVSVSRTDNLLSTQTLRATVAIVPLGYARAIEAEIGLKNPALSVAE